MIIDPKPDLLSPLEIDESLPPISIWMRLGGLFMIGTIGAVVGLAAAIKCNITVKALATVRPVGEIRLVQAALEGSINQIFVKENQVVKKGDAIASIDSQQLQIKKSQLVGNIQQNRQQSFQLDAQIRALDGQIAGETERSDRAVASAEAEMSRTQRDYQDKKVTANTDVQEASANIKIAEDELQKAQIELKSAEANVKATEAALKSSIVKRDRYKSIAESGSISQNQVEEAELEAQRQQQAFLSQKATAESQQQLIERQKRAVEVAIAREKRAQTAVNPSNAILSIAEEKIAQERASAKTSIARLNQERESLVQRQVEIQNQINNTQKELKQIETELHKTIITSPESGSVLKLELRNNGQVVRSGDAIAQIAPSNTLLVIKGRIVAEDVGQVKVCKAVKVVDCPQGKVEMRVSAYPYPDYGILKGAVRSITADTITPQTNSNTPTAPYYEVIIEPEKFDLQKGGKSYPIQPGMEIAVEIISQEETVLTFVLRKARLITDL
ncbi:MAG: HlyD family efflux transporter periplasmic adaptor subunit [Cyanomargarita calcarea GSE-NOS-MK-12-04C]|jgi:HlyD family secretion protein|uniref:HlyD family efflux transporter periplasmic adaptor subunit n=1 Tax=Cyanomargarita calcarea GSE-NOS-MK-12-04C TaxID=2839659 RepID=A0A951QKU7_9CYAN|nr:HlyD family efflux transporter periplasmic adaptor subunit [Cyanomargarita calcarea GSE-NOS-MK-12-04C]